MKISSPSSLCCREDVVGSVSQSTRGVFFWLLLLWVVVDVHTAVVVSATSPFSAHVRGHTIGVTIDHGVFFCLLPVCVSAVVYHTYCCSSHCYITVFGPCSRTHDRCHNRPQCVFLPPPRVCRSKLRLSYMCHRERGVRGVSSVVCYAVLCP